MSERVYVNGELFLSLEVVAELYEVKVLWLRQVHDFGLLGMGAELESGNGPRIAAVELDRVATIVRLHRGLGLDLETIALALDER